MPLSDITDIIKELGGKEKIKTSLEANLSWIYKSFKVNKHLGSSGSRNVLGKWSPPYPETTGYLLPTLLNAAPYYQQENLISLSKLQLKFFEGIKTIDGAYCQNMAEAEPIVFDVAQILLGFIALVPYMEKSTPLLEEIEITRQWLRDILNEKGEFIAFNYVKDFQPAYYSRIAWPLAAAEIIIDSKPSYKTKALIQRLTESQNDNHSFKNWGFRKGQPALTHTIAYTLRGLWEYAEILNSKKIKKQVTLALHRLSKTIRIDGQVAGSYTEDWVGDHSFICSSGNAQLALLYLMVYERNRDKIFLERIVALLKPLIIAQKKTSINAGAISSSIPISGSYQRYKYTNWTQKFYSDALMKLLEMGVE